MKQLALEPYVFDILDNHFALNHFLGEHNWLFEMDAGEVMFTDVNGENPLAQCPVQVLGSVSAATNSWLWGWANTDSNLPQRLVGFGRTLVAAAQQQRKPEFSSHAPFPLRYEHHSQEIAIIATGFSGLFTFYACATEQSTVILGIESCPQAKTTPRTVEQTESVITTAVSLFSFEHKPALLAYLGQHEETDVNQWEWSVNGDWFQVQFDESGRITVINY